MPDWTDPVAMTFWQLAAQAQASDALTPSQRDAVEVFLTVQATNAAAGYVDRGFVPDMENLGYVREVGEAPVVRIPYHLVDLLPLKDALHQALSVAEAMRIDPNGSICLSGSTTLMAVAGPLGDIDLCEYYGDDPGLLGLRIAQVGRAGALATVIKVRIARRDYRRSAEPDGPRLCEALKVPPGSEHPARKALISGIHGSGILGMLPITSKVLPISSASPDEGYGEDSFAYQEIVVTAAGKPPRSLVKPTELGRYLAWLVSDARRNLRDPARVPKALKRIVSFARIVADRSLEAEASEVLNMKVLAEITKLRREKSCRSLLNNAHPDLRVDVEAALNPFAPPPPR